MPGEAHDDLFVFVRFTMTSNGTILAATDQAVKFWGHKHELDVIGSKRVNGGPSPAIAHHGLNTGSDGRVRLRSDHLGAAQLQAPGLSACQAQHILI